jgi:hypothetical protein
MTDRSDAASAKCKWQFKGSCVLLMELKLLESYEVLK